MEVIYEVMKGSCLGAGDVRIMRVQGVIMREQVVIMRRNEIFMSDRVLIITS